MNKSLEFVRSENEKLYHSNGDLKSSLEKKYFEYVCHEPDSACQLKPVVCRVVDKLQPDAEAVWEVDESVCNRCFATDNRLLEDLYR